MASDRDTHALTRHAPPGISATISISNRFRLSVYSSFVQVTAGCKWAGSLECRDSCSVVPLWLHCPLLAFDSESRYNPPATGWLRGCLVLPDTPSHTSALVCLHPDSHGGLCCARDVRSSGPSCGTTHHGWWWWRWCVRVRGCTASSTNCNCRRAWCGCCWWCHVTPVSHGPHPTPSTCALIPSANLFDVLIWCEQVRRLQVHLPLRGRVAGARTSTRHQGRPERLVMVRVGVAFPLTPPLACLNVTFCANSTPLLG